MEKRTQPLRSENDFHVQATSAVLLCASVALSLIALCLIENDAVINSLLLTILSSCTAFAAGALAFGRMRKTLSREDQPKRVAKATATFVQEVKSSQNAIAPQAEEKAAAFREMRSAFTQNVSHELRTPLNSILGFSDLLQNSQELPRQLREYVEAIEGSGKVLLATINDMLDFSMLETGRVRLKRTPFAIAEVISSIEHVVRPAVDTKEVALEWSVSGAVPAFLVGDSAYIQRIFCTLLDNAIKFTEKGKIRVTIDAAARGESILRLLCSIADTGVGIEEDKLQKIFDPFTQADGSSTRRFGGTGLGLSIVASLIELMQGRIWVESEVGKGSTFFFEFDLGLLVPIAAPSLDQNDANEEQFYSQTGRLLVVEDNRTNQQLLMRMLESAGYEVLIAQNGREAVDLTEKEQFDLILMDLQMPVMSGLEAVRSIREREKAEESRIPIIAVTAHALEEHRNECALAGMDGYLPKPIERKRLLSLIREFLPAL